jgi:hypothetical protein
MIKKQTYEVTITSKLEALPIPDIADAIWSRIEAQLDIDLPTNDGGGNNPPSGPTGFGWYGGAGLIVIAAAIITFFSVKKDDQRTEIRVDSVNPSKVDSTEIRALAPVKNPDSKPTTTAPLDIGIVDSSIVVPTDSAIFVQEPALPPIKDSVVLANDQPKNYSLSKDSIPAKKSRGVSGITDSDYRIVPKRKDST